MTVLIENENGFAVNDSGLSAYHKAENGTQLPTGIWDFNLGQTWQAVYACWIGDLDTFALRGHWPDLAVGEFDRIKDASGDWHLYVNYSGDIWYGTGQDAIVTVRNSQNGTINIKGNRAGRGVWLTDCDNVDVVIDGELFGQGVAIQNSTNVRVHDSRLNQSAMQGIFLFENCAGTVIEDNTIYQPGQSESSGGIYANQTDGSAIEWRRNRVFDVPYKRYWIDGSGLYADEGTGNININNNFVTGCLLAFQDNAGLPGNQFVENTVVECGHGLHITDSRNIGQSDTIYARNWLINTSPDGMWPGGQGEHPDPHNIVLRY